MGQEDEKQKAVHGRVPPWVKKRIGEDAKQESTLIRDLLIEHFTEDEKAQPEASSTGTQEVLDKLAELESTLVSKDVLRSFLRGLLMNTWLLSPAEREEKMKEQETLSDDERRAKREEKVNEVEGILRMVFDE